MKKRVLGILLSLCMAVMSLPLSVMAEEEHEHNAGGVCAHSWENGVCTVCNTPCTHDWDGGHCYTCGIDCTHENWTDGVCDVCGTGCEHGEWKDDGADFVYFYLNGVCTICGMPCVHEYGDDGVCIICGMSDSALTPHTHSYTGTVTTVTGCVTPGVMTYTCSCGDSYTQFIAATGHKYYGRKITQATCTEDGAREYTCRYCGNSFRTVIAAMGHNWKGTFTVIDGDRNTGSYVYTCSNCGDSYRESVSGFVTVQLHHNVKMESTVLPGGGMAYIVTEKLQEGSERMQGVTVESDDGNIRYVGYVLQDENGKTLEILEVNSSVSLASLSIDR